MANGLLKNTRIFQFSQHSNQQVYHSETGLFIGRLINNGVPVNSSDSLYWNDPSFSLRHTEKYYILHIGTT